MLMLIDNNAIGLILILACLVFVIIIYIKDNEKNLAKRLKKKYKNT